MVFLIAVQFICTALILIKISGNANTRAVLYKLKLYDSIGVGVVCTTLSFIPFLGAVIAILLYLFYLHYKY